MSRKRLTAWAMVLAVGMTARIAVAAPHAALAELRAAICCAEHCPKTQRTPMPSKRCCMVESAATDPASTAPAPSIDRPATASQAVILPAPSLEIVTQAVLRMDHLPLRAGPPGHPETLKLRC